MNRKTGRMILLGAAVYLTLLLVLLFSEQTQPDSPIRTLGDALWYSLVTMTTVGYGDMVPVSPAGRSVSTVFLLLSVGIMAAVVGAAVSLFRGRVWPALRLRGIRRKPWILFSEDNEVSRALAKDLAAGHPDLCILYCGCPESRKLEAADGCQGLQTVLPLKSVLQCRSFRGGERTAVLVSPDPWKNIAAAELPGLPEVVYAMGPGQIQAGNAVFFDRCELCARRYWQLAPLEPQEHVILLVGDGALAEAILLQGMLVSIREPWGAAAYHCFGNWDGFSRCHPVLCEQLNREDAYQDTLHFHTEPWNDDPALLSSADRIIFCAEDETVNTRRTFQLAQWFPVNGTVWAASSVRELPARTFGSAEELYTEDLVMNGALDRRAQDLHSAYIRRTGSGQSWEDLSPFQKASNRAAADHLLTKLRLLLPERDVREVTPEICRLAACRYHELSPEDREKTRQNEHARWCRFLCLYNWRWAPERNNSLRKHPNLVPYTALSEAERKKDDSAWEQIGELFPQQTSIRR